MATRKPTDKKTPKKTPVKKVTKRVAKEVQTKPTRQRTVPLKKKVPKKVTKKASKTPVKSKTKDKINSDTVEKELRLPANASLRTISKSTAIRENLDEYIERCVYKVAFTSSLCFVLVGASIIGTSLFLPKDDAASVISNSASVANSIQTSNNKTESIQIENKQTTFKLLTEIPKVIKSDTELRINYTAQYFNDIEIRLYKTGSLKFTTLDPSPLTDDKYRFVIQSGNLEPGYYRLEFILNSNSSNHPLKKYSPEFSIQALEVIDAVPKESNNSDSDPKSTIDEDKNVDTDTDADTVIDIQADSTVKKAVDNQGPFATTTTEESIKLNELTQEGSRLESQTEYEEKLTDDFDVESDLDTISQTPQKEFSDIIENLTDKQPLVEDDDNKELLLPDTAIMEDTLESESLVVDQAKLSEGFLEINISSLGEFEYVEIYVKKINSTREQFLSSANQRGDNWHASVNTVNLPDGTYLIFARSQDLKSNYFPFRINNLPIASKVEDEKKEPDVSNVSDVKESDFSETKEEADRDFSKLVIQPSSPELKTNITEKVKLSLEDTDRNIEGLFKRYAAAVQAEDDILIREMNTEIEKAKAEIVSDAFRADKETPVDDFRNTLNDDIADIKQKVEVFEKVRRDRSSGQSSVDTDQDGISDFDETEIFKTDPMSPDSDRDGINDGLEIIRGFNPLDSKPEVIIEFESPRETIGLTRDDSFVIEQVIPVIPVNGPTKDQPLKAEIRGKALPNSFVTLFIFSTPTIVTVKTDSDGSFVYTFEKELEDGEHEVFVAMTDNTGTIIAQSNPFRFIKEAEAFSPAAGSVVLSGQSPELPINGNTFSLVIGMSIISLGVILLLLGIGVRTKSPEEFEEIKVASNQLSWPSVTIKNKSVN